MKLLVCGSRSIDDINHVNDCLDEIFQEYGELITELIEGGANGVDSLAGLYAKSHNISLTTIYAEWKRIGKTAGYIRNKEMVELCDKGVAIWDGYSKGTKITIDLLKKANKLIKVFQ